jgi:hypothetical protein
MLVIGGREPAADVQDLDLVVAAVPCLFENAVGDAEGLHVVLEIRALTAHVKGQALHHQPGVEGGFDQIHGLAR